jgi:glycerol dehydrogenase-like iron-containing ADH family enzyme
LGVGWFAPRERRLGGGPRLAHLFAWNLERVTGRTFLHGEAVALGVIVASGLQAGRSEHLRDVLDRARVPWRPRQLGIDRSAFGATLETIADYNRSTRRIPSIVDIAPWGPARLPALWETLG